MDATKTANDLVAFLLELLAVAALAWWGFAFDGPVVVRILLGIAAPAAMIGIWGSLLAPKARRRLPMPWLVVAKVVVFGVAALALGAAGGVWFGVAFAAVAVVNLGLAVVWGRV